MYEYPYIVRCPEALVRSQLCYVAVGVRLHENAISSGSRAGCRRTERTGIHTPTLPRLHLRRHRRAGTRPGPPTSFGGVFSVVYVALRCRSFQQPTSLPARSVWLHAACALAIIASIAQGRAVVDGKDHVLIPCFTNLHLETSGIPLDELEAVLTEALDESWRCGVTTTVVLADDDCAARRIQVASRRRFGLSLSEPPRDPPVAHGSGAQAEIRFRYGTSCPRAWILGLLRLRRGTAARAPLAIAPLRCRPSPASERSRGRCAMAW